MPAVLSKMSFKVCWWSMELPLCIVAIWLMLYFIGVVSHTQAWEESISDLSTIISIDTLTLKSCESIYAACLSIGNGDFEHAATLD